MWVDSWVDIEGGIGMLFIYVSFGSWELFDDMLWLEDELIFLLKEGGFVVCYLLILKLGVVVYINVFNFFCWGMLEKLVLMWLGGMLVIIKLVIVMV